MKYDDLAKWYSDTKLVSEGVKSYMTEEDKKTGPKGPGYVFTLYCITYHEGVVTNYVRETLLWNLQHDVISRLGADNVAINTPVQQMGISHAAIVDATIAKPIMFYPNGRPDGVGPGGSGPRAISPSGFGANAPSSTTMRLPAPGFGTGSTTRPAPIAVDEGSPLAPIQVTPSSFILTFAWKPTPKANRKPAEPVMARSTSGADGAVTPAAPAAAIPASGGVAPGVTPQPGPAGVPAGGLPSTPAAHNAPR
jgi:hypothetical protein